MKFGRMVALALALLMAVLPVAAFADAADQSLDKIMEKGELVLGLDDSFPPMGFVDANNQIVGFDIDVATEVCARMGIKLKLQPIDWDAKDLELSSGNIDCIWNGMSITPEREASMALSVPYMKNQIALVVRKGTYASKADLAGKKVGVQSGSFGEKVLDDPANADFRASLSEVLTYDDYLTALMDLKNGGSDAVAMDLIVAEYEMTQSKDEALEVIDSLVDDLYVVGFRKADLALRDKVNEVLAAMASDGKLNEISTKWFGEDLSIVGKAQ